MSNTMQDTFVKLLEATIRAQVEVSIHGAVEEAKNKIEREIIGHADKMALSILRKYSITDMNDHIVIRVEKNI